MAKKRRRTATSETKPTTHEQATAILEREDKNLLRIFDTYVVIGLRKRTEEERKLGASEEALMYFHNGPITVLGSMALDTYVDLLLKAVGRMGVCLTDTQKEEVRTRVERALVRGVEEVTKET